MTAIPKGSHTYNLMIKYADLKLELQELLDDKTFRAKHERVIEIQDTLDEMSGEMRVVADYELTEREIQVLTRLAEAKTNAEIGAELYISPETVRTHLRKAMSKLDCSTRTQAVAKAISLGLVFDTKAGSRNERRHTGSRTAAERILKAV